MNTKFVEATQGLKGGMNWGKFMVARFDQEEWGRPSELVERLGRDPHQPMNPWGGGSLLAGRGWTQQHIAVFDLQTGEGAFFKPGGLPAADLAKHKVWVCPMFEPFLVWLYGYIAGDPDEWWYVLPALVELPDAPGAMFGYRREGHDNGESAADDPESGFDQGFTPVVKCAATLGEQGAVPGGATCELEAGHGGQHRFGKVEWNYDARRDEQGHGVGV